MFLPQKNVSHVFVSKNPTDIVDTSGTITGYADLADGAIAFLDRNNTAVSDITTVDVFRIALRAGTSLLFSPWIKRSSIVRAKTTSYSAPVQQVIHIGSNGTTGSILAINDNNYIINILLKSTTGQFGNKQMYKTSVYVSDPSATQPEVAVGLIQNLVSCFARETVDYFRFDLLSSAAVVAGDCFDHAATIVNGSDIITIATNLQYSTAEDLAIGDYVRVGGVGVGTAVTNGVYKVTELIDTTHFRVDRVVNEASGTYAVATADLVVLRPAAVLAANMGIKLTGLAQTNFQVGAISQYLVDAEIGLVNFDESTTVVYTTKSSKGKGTYYDVADMEWFSQGNWGKQARLGIPPPTSIQNADSSGIYDLISFGYSDTMEGGVIGIPASSYGEIIIAIRCDGPAHVKANALLDVLQTDTTHFPSALCPNFA